MPKIEDIYDRCTNVLPGHRSRRTMKVIFQSLADEMQGDEYSDNYGEGEYISRFEAEMADLFGKEAAVFMPSGTMAQQIALRIHCEKRNNFTVAMHPTAHLEQAEHLGYQYLHQIKRIQFTAPESIGDRLWNLNDLIRINQEPGVILMELPCRPLGGELPAWDELIRISTWAKERRIPFHMDGARVWSCRPFYQKEFNQIASLFDSLYISFYKDLGGLAGSMLLGPAGFIKESRLWQRRQGGNLTTMAPFVASAKIGVEKVIPQINGWVKRAQEVAAVLSRYEKITIRPNPPQVNFFQVYIQGDAEKLTQKHLTLADETGTFLFYGFGTTMVPGISRTEIHCWENSMKFNLENLPGFLDRLLE